MTGEPVPPPETLSISGCISDTAETPFLTILGWSVFFIIHSYLTLTVRYLRLVNIVYSGKHCVLHCVCQWLITPIGSHLFLFDWVQVPDRLLRGMHDEWHCGEIPV